MIKLRHIVMGGLILVLSGCDGTTGTGTSSSGFRPTKMTRVTTSTGTINGVKQTITYKDTKTYSYDSNGKAIKNVLTSTYTNTNQTNKFTNELSNFNSNNLPQSIKNTFNDTNSSSANTYDSHGYLTIVINTDSKGVTSTENYTNTYDIKGNLTEIVSKNNTSTYQYNTNNLITQSTYSSGNSTPLTYTFEYNINNQMTKAISTDGDTTLTYNSNGQLTKMESKSFITTYEYENKSCLFYRILSTPTYKHLSKSICKK